MVLSYIIVVLSTISFIYGLRFLKNDTKIRKNWYFFLTSIASTIWGLGFGLLLIQKDSVGALYCRAFGMIGVFLYSIFGIKLLTSLAESPSKLKKILSYFSYLAIPLYPFVILPDRQEFYMGRFGMTYTFANDVWNTLYNVYCIVVLLVFIVVLIKMRKDAVYKRQKVLNNRLWLFFIAFTAGVVLDTLLPMFGIGSFPGSTLSQFVAIFIVYSALIYEKKNALDLENVSDHLYHSIEMPILVLNQDMQISFISDSSYKYFNIKKGEEHNTKISDLFILESEDAIYSIIRKNIVKECFVRNNNYYCSLTIESVKDSYEDIIGYIIVVTDLTEKNKFITQLEEAKNSVEQASKSKDNFLANMSHEIRTPLNAIAGINELILCQEENPKIKDYSEQIKIASKKLINIVDDLFDFSKIQTGKLEMANVDYSIVDMIKSILDNYRDALLEKQLDFKITIDESVPKTISGDEKRVKQCITNLIKNAIKYTETGSVSIKVYTEKMLGSDVDLVVEVIDTGIGIKREDIDKVFVSFNGLEDTNNRVYEGTGLGLTIVKKLMNLMNGTLEIESEYGEGSKFIMKFPQKIVDKEESGGLVLTSSDKKIFVLDDKSVDIMILKKLLQKTTYMIESDTYDNVNVLNINRNQYDYVFCNYDKNINEHIDAFLKELIGTNVVCLVEDFKVLDNFKKMKKPVNEEDLNKIFNGEYNEEDLSIESDIIESGKIYLPRVRMLLVDDNKINLMVLKGFLKDTEAIIDTCTSGTEALQMVNEKRYDIIFLDHMMPGMDGIETLKQIKSLDKDWVKSIPVIVVTANAVDGAEEFYLDKGFTEYISKPVDTEFLEKVLIKYLPKEFFEKKE